LLCVGVGRQYGDQLMEQLADHGDGFAVYVSQRAQARRLFVDRLPGTLEVAARDAKAQVAFDPGNVAGYQLLGYEDRAVPNRDFRNNAADGGEVGPGHSVTALYLVTLRPDAYGTVATATARWLSPRTGCRGRRSEFGIHHRLAPATARLRGRRVRREAPNRMVSWDGGGIA
jgi:Ca-activated chloride channel family protein